MQGVTGIVLVFTTAPADDRAEAIAAALVEERLAACVNIGAPMTSIYRWRTKVERDRECQLVIKTTTERLPALELRIRELHPYELPELLVVAVSDGSSDYLEWVRAETAESDSGSTR